MSLELGAPFPEQGLASAHYPALARRLAQFFPGLKPHDLYRFTSVAALLEGWDAAPDTAAAAPTVGAAAQAALEILGSGVRLPPCVRSAAARQRVTQHFGAPALHTAPSLHMAAALGDDRAAPCSREGRAQEAKATQEDLWATSAPPEPPRGPGAASSFRRRRVLAAAWRLGAPRLGAPRLSSRAPCAPMRTPQACWDALSAETCAIDDCPIEGFKATPSGFLQPPFSKAEAKAACADPKLAVSPPEAGCMDPQQARA